MNLTLGTLNFNDAGNWLGWQKAAVCLGIVILVVALGAVALLYGNGMFEKLHDGQATELRLRTDYSSRKLETINLESYRRQHSEIGEELEALVRKLPSKQEIDALLVDVNQAGIARGLEFALFKPQQEKRASNGFYMEIPINIKLTGDYHGMGGFVSDVAALSRVVTVGDVGIVYDKGVLSMESVAKTFRYLNEKELQEAQGQEQGAQQ